MGETRQTIPDVVHVSPYGVSAALVTGVAIAGLGPGGLVVTLVLIGRGRYLSTPATCGLLTATVVLLSGSDPSELTLVASIIVVLSPLLLPSADGYSRTHRYLLMGAVALVVPMLFIVLTAGVVWPAALVAATTLLGATLAVYWYTVPL